MDSAIVGAIASVAVSYATIGIAVAAAFLIHGVGRVVPNAHASYVFRLLLIPGAVLLWPLVLRRWAVLRRQPAHNTP